MNKLNYLVFFTIMFSLSLKSQSFEWAVSMGAENNDYGNSITTDSFNNVYTTGYFSSTVDFNPGSGVNNLTSNGGTDVFIQKLDNNGNFLWAKKIGGTGSDNSTSITTDQNNNVYIIGYFYGTVDFNPGSGVHNLTSNQNSRDIFILKLDSNGNFLWVKSINGSSDDMANAIVIRNNFMYLTGFYGNTVDFDLGSGIHNITSNGNSDLFILKLDLNGNFVWVKSIGGTRSEYPASMALDLNNNICITGYFAEIVDFDPGANIFNLSSVGGTKDIFVLKLDPSGNFLWAKSIGSGGDDVGYSIATDNNGNIYTTGEFEQTIDLDPGAPIDSYTSLGQDDIFIQKLDTNGNFLWATRIGSTWYENAGSICIDNENNIYTTGSFSRSADFDPGTNELILTPTSYDMFIQKLDSNGNLLYVKKTNGGGQEHSSSIHLDSNSSILLTGRFGGSSDFDPGAGVHTLTSTSGGYFDTFILKLNSSSLSLEDFKKPFFSLYPNPAKNQITISFKEPINKGTIAIYNSIGQKVFYKKTNAALTKNNLDISNLSKGIYLLKLELMNKVHTEKLIIE